LRKRKKGAVKIAWNSTKSAGDLIRSSDWNDLVSAIENTSSGHNHDGSNSKLIDNSNIQTNWDRNVSGYVYPHTSGDAVIPNTTGNLGGVGSEWNTGYFDNIIITTSFTDGTATLASGAWSGITTLAMTGNMTLSNNIAIITHSGTTSLTISSTSGTVNIESVQFSGQTISNITNITASGTITDGTYSSSGGAFTGVVSITDGTATWGTSSLSGFTSISGTTLTDTVASLSSGALSGITTISMNNQLTNTLADGTAPFVITSTTLVTNLNSEHWNSKHLGSVSDGKLLRYNSTGTQIETGTVTESSGALGAITTLSMSSNLTMSGNTVNITHSGSTSLTITSTNGTVAIESVVFTGGALSSVSSITDGTASWSTSSLSGFTSISGTTLTDTTASLSSGALTGMVSITDGTASWSSSSLSGFTSISATTITDGVTSISSGAYTGVASITDGTASWSSSNLSGFGTIACTSTITAVGTITTGNASTTGSLLIYDGSSHKITLTSPSISSDWTITLPVDSGSSNQVLVTDGSGNTSWEEVNNLTTNVIFGKTELLFSDTASVPTGWSEYDSGAEITITWSIEDSGFNCVKFAHVSGGANRVANIHSTSAINITPSSYGSGKPIKEFHMMFAFKFVSPKASGDDESFMGLSADPDRGRSTNNLIGFGLQNGDELITITDNGGSETTTDISSGIDITEWHICEIVVESSTSVKFYVDGTLKSTHTEDIPDDEMYVMTELNPSTAEDEDLYISDVAYWWVYGG